VGWRGGWAARDGRVRGLVGGFGWGSCGGIDPDEVGCGVGGAADVLQGVFWRREQVLVLAVGGDGVGAVRCS
jgi:hypothetical protein